MESACYMFEMVAGFLGLPGLMLGLWWFLQGGVREQETRNAIYISSMLLFFCGVCLVVLFVWLFDSFVVVVWFFVCFCFYSGLLSGTCSLNIPA